MNPSHRFYSLYRIIGGVRERQQYSRTLLNSSCVVATTSACTRQRHLLCRPPAAANAAAVRCFRNAVGHPKQQPLQCHTVSTFTSTLHRLYDGRRPIAPYHLQEHPDCWSMGLLPRRSYSLSIQGRTLCQHLISNQQRLLEVNRKCMSTITDSTTGIKATGDGTNTKKSSTDDDGTEQKPPSDKSNSSGNIFLDNLGTVFLLFIGSIIGWLVRSYYNGVRKNMVREQQIESTAQADPIELDDLRIANTELTPHVFYEIQQYIIDHAVHGGIEVGTNDSQSSSSSSSSLLPSTATIWMTYPKFVQLVRTAMIQSKGEDAFTIQCGHIMDRVVVAALSKQTKKLPPPKSDVGIDSEPDDSIDAPGILVDTVEMPIEFWLTVLSLALYSSSKERIQVLHNVFTHQCSGSNQSILDRGNIDSSNNSNNKISMDQVLQLIGYLQDTCQLVPDAQVIMTSSKYPLQEYIVGTPQQMIDHQQSSLGENKDDQRDSKTTATRINDDSNITVDMLCDILTSRSVCAWGECYKYKSK